MPNFALKVTRLGLSLLQAVSPRLAGKAAFRLFCLTPSPKPKGAKAKAAHAAGRAFLQSAERIELRLAGGRRAHAYRINGGAAGRRQRCLVTHGWGSSMEYMTDLIGALAASGAEVIGVDFPGHGRAGGRFLHMGLAVQTIAAAQARFGPFDATVGHSFGGAALMVSAAGLLPEIEPLSTGKIVTIGSPSEMKWLFADFGRMVGLKKAAQTALEGEVHRLTGRGLEDFDAGEAAATMRRPMLVIHAQDDKEVSASHARRYAASGRSVRLFWANGFGHRRIVSAEPVLAEIQRFLADNPIKNDVGIIPLFGLPGRRASL
ncbi:alpha/beta hydrolase family protein [Rhizobium etli 8C-3]|uniref:Alpha/beta hydrolase family protein n=1 Tax=Rhizobium etli 8C-3 TaxID=538025 RepID=A0A1L5P4G6_RHIET|nr:alpha/beta hydrolase [Rhizobium etli]APO75037.1 alpha/beta hydrolase family protein [Rhizobium etli 8C-3]